MYQHLWDEAFAVHGWKFIALYNCSRKEDLKLTKFLPKEARYRRAN